MMVAWTPELFNDLCVCDRPPGGSMNNEVLNGSCIDPLLLGMEWVQARLGHDPRTRHLLVSVRAQGDTLLLEGHASTLTEKLWAGQVARQSQAWGRLDNRILVSDGGCACLAIPSPPIRVLPRLAVA